MVKLTMAIGLSGSGKSTWAREQVVQSHGQTIRVNKDDIRSQIHADVFGGKREGITVKARNALIRMGLQSGLNVISDDTNLNPVHETGLRSIAKECGAEFEIKDFRDVPIDTCIKQDLMRAKSVGEGVIREMYDKWMKPAPRWLTQWDSDKQAAVIVDLDGTSAYNDGHRDFYDYAKVGADKEHLPVVDVVRALIKSGRFILFVSGRDDSCYPETFDWLTRTFGPSDDIDTIYSKGSIPVWKLLMRKTGDKRQDAVTKKEIFDNDIEPHYNVLYCIDDRRTVVDLWRSLGILTFDVADGRF